MPDIVIYASATCPYCRWARALLDKKGAHYTVIDVDHDPRVREEMRQRSRRHTVPQIFIGERHIGGFDDLSALDRAGELDPLLAA
ncbi:MAG: glutaredoxin 3 [Gammaproteobacteria bacterium]